MDNNDSNEIVLPELYFLIQKFLSGTPMVKTLEVFQREASEHKLLPRRLDWEGNSHERSFTELEQLHRHIKADHLLSLCTKIQSFFAAQPSSNSIRRTSLLGYAVKDFLEKKDSSKLRRCFQDYAVRIHGIPSYDNVQRNHNITNIVRGLEISGPLHRKYIVNPSFYSHLKLQRQTLGHLSAIYCLLFDHSGRYIVTGADDLLVKLWSAVNGRLLATFRGASSEISDIAVNIENTLLAAGSLDKVLRVWNIQSGAPVAVLVGHTGMITSVNFCPSCHLDVRYLVSTSTDGSVAFWAYRYENSHKVTFEPKPLMYSEKIRPGVSAQMICSSFSPGGLFLATGSADHHVRIYFMEGDEGPYRLLEVLSHSDRVDSIQWAHRGLRFLSGSKDGVANIWYFESQQWRNMQLLMSAKLPDEEQKTDETKKLKVTMVCWDCSDTWVITAVSDLTLKIWRASTGQLEAVLKGHLDEIYVLEPHPKDANVVLSAGHDGHMFIWNILKKTHLFTFVNNIEGQGNAAVFDAKWSYDGNRFAASDSHGHIHIFGFGTGSAQFNFLPKELFFHTDYRPLVKDANHVVVDEQTQVPPHLMPPPFLVDVDGNPYPPMLQRLVPGRENCKVEQLIPNIVVGMEGTQEIIEGLSDEQIAERMISLNYGADQPGSIMNDLRQENAARFGSRSVIIRRSGDIEGVRQSSGNWQRDPDTKWKKNTLVQQMKFSEVERIRDNVKSHAWYEMEEYRREMKRRPIMITTAPTTSQFRDRKKKLKGKSAAYLTRSVMVNDDLNDDDQDPDDSSASSKDIFITKDDDSSLGSSDSSDSSPYSDWGEEHGNGSLERSKRSKRKAAQRTSQPTSEEDNEPEAREPRERKPSPVPKPPPPVVIKEIPEMYKPLEWLAQTVPRKAPYCPQIGDEVVYFKQGHLLYLEAVKNKKLYEVNPKDIPWNKCEIKDEEFVKIIEIKYEIRPPRLCCLKLAILDNENRLVGTTFSIKYHDMADVLDFFVLKQGYDIALSRCWNLEDKFRCMIDDCWWVGEIISKSPVSEMYPNSLFMCYEIRWFNGEYERMSPWDLEPICSERLPQNLSEAVPVLPEELQLMLYQPQSEEWPHGTREECCRYIIVGLEKIMELAIAEPFLTPVDLSYYPTYAFIIEYPIDLSTIKSRFENHFYRRITAAQFDIRFLQINAEKFNEPTSIIVKHARILVELCFRVISAGPVPLDISSLYRQLMDNYESSEEEVEVDEVQPSTSAGVTAKKNYQYAEDWKQEMKILFDALWHCEDSYPFRKPVDSRKHPDYYRIIDTPIDLSTIREDLMGGNYNTPMEFCADVKLMLQNSKNYNTNKKSKIYGMTVRLQSMFEQHFKKVLYNWKVSERKLTTDKKMNLRKKKNNHTLRPGSDSDTSVSGSLYSQSEAESVEDIKPSKPKDVHNNLHTANNISNSLKQENSNSKYVNGTSSTTIRNSGKRSLPNTAKKATDNEASPSSNSDEDSDYQPLTELKECNPRHRPKGRRPSRDSESSNSSPANSSSSDASSDEKEPTPSVVRPRVKRRRLVSSSDDDSDVKQNSSSNSDGCIVSVSSRGRIRKLTSRVRALLKK